MNTQDTGLAVIIGALLPMLISVVVQTDWGDQAKAVAAFLVCVIAAVIGSFVADGVSVADPGFDWVAWFAGIYGTAMVAWRQFYKPTGITPAIEGATNVGGGGNG